MAVSTLPSIGKALGRQGFQSSPSRPQAKRNALCTPPLAVRAASFSKIKTDVVKFSLKCKAMSQSGQTKGNSVVLEASTNTDIVQIIPSSAEIVREFYARINRHEVESVADLIAENCVYEDLVFPQPFVGRKDILDFFKRFTDAVSTDLQFVIDDITGQDVSAVGVTWHLEWRGKAFPFSKGCSFYRCEIFKGKRQIIYSRDSVEPAAKPGDMALVAINTVTSLLERFPVLADRF